jgi:hypothetical protein
MSMNFWIPVGESLPDDDTVVLVALSDGEVWTGYLDAGTWIDNVAGAPFVEVVTHWQHLPEPPLD